MERSIKMNPPPYPTPFRILSNLISKRDDLLSDMIFMEKSLSTGDFHDWAKLVRARKDLKELNAKLGDIKGKRN